MKSFKMIVSSHSRNFGCNDEGPFWAELTVDQELIDYLLKMVAFSNEFKLELIEKEGRPDSWMNEDEYRISGHTLCVIQRLFCFRAYQKHSCDLVATDWMSIDIIVSFFRSKNNEIETIMPNQCHGYLWVDDVLYYSDDGTENLVESVRSHHEKSI